MSEIKDKKIAVYFIETKRCDLGHEQKIKHFIHNRLRLWAYVRDLSDRERFAAKAAGAQKTTVFKIAFNKKIGSEMYIEFNGTTYQIESIEGGNFYKQDLTISAYQAKAAAADYETYDEQ